MCVCAWDGVRCVCVCMGTVCVGGRANLQGKSNLHEPLHDLHLRQQLSLEGLQP